jgi:hypothetical protein
MRLQAAQPSGLNTRTAEGGFFSNLAAGRIGRRTSSPPQFGQMPLSFLSTQSAQKLHSKEQIIASVAAGGRSLLQHSQFGRKSSIGFLLEKLIHPTPSSS